MSSGSVDTSGSADSHRTTDGDSSTAPQRLSASRDRSDAYATLPGRATAHDRTISTHTLPQPHEPSTGTTPNGRSVSPPDTLLNSGSASRSAGTRSSTAARFAVPTQRAGGSAADGAGGRGGGGGGQDVRDTAEYRAAWDLELWKAVQAERFRKELDKHRAAAFAELDRVVRRREKEARIALHQRTAAVALREEAVKADEARLAEWQQRVSDMEKDVRRMRQQLLDAQQRVEDEVRAQVRLANDTIAHRARLLEERVKAAEAQARRADERQRQAQQEYLSLYEAFSRYRTQQLTAPAGSENPSGGGGVVATSAPSSAVAALQLEQLRGQWSAEHQLQLERQAQRHATEIDAVQRRCRELEEQNTRLAAALARRREQLRSLKAAAPSQSRLPAAEAVGSEPAPAAAAASLRPAHSPAPGRATTGASSTSTTAATAVRDAVERTTRELRRLEGERAALVEGSSGALREGDAVIVRIDARMRELRAHLAAVAAASVRA